MDYYVSTFSSFGTQAALFGGFTLAAIVHLDVGSFESHIMWKTIFWISTSFCMCCSLHNVLTTTFANVFGPHLALRGPSGYELSSDCCSYDVDPWSVLLEE